MYYQRALQKPYKVLLDDFQMKTSTWSLETHGHPKLENLMDEKLSSGVNNQNGTDNSFRFEKHWPKQ